MSVHLKRALIIAVGLDARILHRAGDGHAGFDVTLLVLDEGHEEPERQAKTPLTSAVPLAGAIWSAPTTTSLSAVS